MTGPVKTNAAQRSLGGNPAIKWIKGFYGSACLAQVPCPNGVVGGGPTVSGGAGKLSALRVTPNSVVEGRPAVGSKGTQPAAGK